MDKIKKTKILESSLRLYFQPFPSFLNSEEIWLFSNSLAVIFYQIERTVSEEGDIFKVRVVDIHYAAILDQVP